MSRAARCLWALAFVVAGPLGFELGDLWWALAFVAPPSTPASSSSPTTTLARMP